MLLGKWTENCIPRNQRKKHKGLELNRHKKIFDSEQYYWDKHKRQGKKLDSTIYIDDPEKCSTLLTIRDISDSDLLQPDQFKRISFDKEFRLIHGEHPGFQWARKNETQYERTPGEGQYRNNFDRTWVNLVGSYYHNKYCEHWWVANLQGEGDCPSRPIYAEETPEIPTKAFLGLEEPTVEGHTVISHNVPEEVIYNISYYSYFEYIKKTHLIPTKEGLTLKSCIRNPTERIKEHTDYLFPEHLTGPFWNTQDYKLSGPVSLMEGPSDTKPAKRTKKISKKTVPVANPNPTVASVPKPLSLFAAGIQLEGSTHSQLLGTEIEKLKDRHGHTTIYNTRSKQHKQGSTTIVLDSPANNNLEHEVAYTPREVPETLGLNPVIEESPNTPPTEDKTDTNTPTTPRKRKYSWLQSAEV
jgi:hypothetical protein